MKVAILTLGSRGDVQPYVALGAGLEAAGHEVILATGKGFAEFVAGHGLRHAALDVDLFERMQTPEGKAALAGKNLPGTIRKVMATYRRLLDDEWAAARGADAVVYHPKALGGYHIAEALGVPSFLAHPVPMFSPTRAFPSPVLPVEDLGGYLNKASYGAFLRLMTAPFHRAINRWREETLRLPPRRFLATELELWGGPVRTLVCSSPRVVPPPADWGGSTTVTGYWFLDRPEGWRPPERLISFLEDGPPPVYVGFGSLGGWTSEKVVAAAITALERSGLRGVLATGGGRVPLGLPKTVCAIESAPHDWLFPRMAAVVHHGGAGTTAEGLRAGKPAVICPTTLNDQLFWGRRLFELGVGPEPIPQKKLTVERLTGAIRDAATDRGMRRRAADLGEKIRAERGVARAVEVIDSRGHAGGSGGDGRAASYPRRPGATAKMPAADSGAFPGGLHYVRVGDGPENLVVLPGITLDNRPPGRLVAQAHRLGFRRFAQGQTVYLINRRTNVPTGFTTRDMAADYARVIEQEIGPSRLMGLSTGGLIAQHLALDHPELVRRLVLVVAASRLSEKGRGICERWQELARRGERQELQTAMLSVVTARATSRLLAGAFVGIFGGFMLGKSYDPSDFLATLEAVLGHDTMERLPGLAAPTLVIGGSEDPFFPPALLRETAAAIPGAGLRVYGGVGHGVPKERKSRFEEDALAFLAGPRRDDAPPAEHQKGGTGA